MKTTPWHKIKEFARFLKEYSVCKCINQASINSGYVLKDYSEHNTKDYYVYFLINPKTDKIFYVGKGKGKRALQHYKQYKDKKEKNFFKYKEIESFAKLGYKPIIKIVADNLKEQDAYRIETKLIKKLYKTLTNISQNENEPNLLKKEIKKLLKRLPTYEAWITGVYYNAPIVFKILAQDDFGKGLYADMKKALLNIGKEYGVCNG